MIINIEILIFLSIFGEFSNLLEINFNLLTISITLFLMVLVTQNYQKLKQKNFENRMLLMNENKRKREIKLFLKMIFYGFIFVLFWIFYIYLFNEINFGFNSKKPNKTMDWSIFPWSLYFYYGLAQTMMIIVFTYVINNVVKNVSIIYGIIIGITVYLFINGYLFGLPLTTRDIEGIDNQWLVWGNNNSGNEVFINTILLPWTTFTLFGKAMFLKSRIAAHNYKEINWFDMSHMNDYLHTDYGYFYSSITWSPYIFSIIPLIIVKVIKS